MYITLYSCPVLMTLGFSRKIFEKSSNIKFNKTPSSGIGGVPYGRTDMTNPILDRRNFANAPKTEFQQHELLSIL
jgi:hypothetical protein